MAIRWNDDEIDRLNELAARIHRLEELAIAQAKVNTNAPGTGKTMDDMNELLAKIEKEHGPRLDLTDAGRARAEAELE